MKKTLHNKRKATTTKMSDKYMLNRAMNLLESKRERKPLVADKLFEKSIGETLKKILDIRCKEFVKLKI